MLITSELKYVTRNGTLEIAVRPPVVTLTGEYVAPVGTVTLSESVEAALTVALVAPKYTTLLEGVELKFDPEMVTELPIGPVPGLIAVMVGICPNVQPVMRKSNPSTNEQREVFCFIVRSRKYIIQFFYFMSKSRPYKLSDETLYCEGRIDRQEVDKLTC